MAGGIDRLVAPGRHTRRPGQAGLRRMSVSALIMLVVQYGLGIFLNLYVSIPASDAHAGFFQEIATAPLALTVHALLGLGLIGTAILLVARAVGMRDRLLAVLATAGLTAIGGAFGAGEIFVKNGQSSASLAMAVLTGVALLCYIGTLVLAATVERQATEPELATGFERPLLVRMPRQRPPATPPTPWPATSARRNWPAEERWAAEERWRAEERRPAGY
jgi:hypothetical protein